MRLHLLHAVPAASGHRTDGARPSSARAPRARTRRATGVVAAAALALTGTAAAGLGSTASAADAAPPSSVALVGSLQDELGCDADWAPACTTTALTDPDGDGTWTYTATVPAGSYEVKVALNGTWDVSYGKDGAESGDNIPLVLEQDAALTFAWNQDTHRLALASDELTGSYTSADDSLVSAPVRQGGNEQFYFIMTDRFANGDTSNDTGGLTGGRSVTGLDPTDEGYYHGGDIQGIIDHLDYIQSLGTTAVWLTPSFANQPTQGEGANESAGYHGYWVTDFTSIDAHLGGNEALARLRDALHERGMKLYLDIITNHTADLIDYQEGQYSYVDTATKPYTDADGNTIDISALADKDGFPTLSASSSFPYTPVRTGTVIPDALNDVTLYHNRGNSTWTGESVTMGDFDGLDDLMTENPTVEKTFVQVYESWMDFGVDGFRIDTVKHVNFDFWRTWTTAVDAHAADTNPDFFTFGEVYDADATRTSPYVRQTGMDATLDFAFQAGALNYAKGYTAGGLSQLFASDDYYTTAHSSVYAEPTFLGNHDMGRLGYLLGGGTGSTETLERDELAHELMFLTRGQPVVYYGDEQGFAGSGGDKASRQDMFGTQVSAFATEQLVDGTTEGTSDHYDTSSALYQKISGLAQLRSSSKALSSGSQIELHADDGAGVYAFARVDRDEKVEHLVALNNATGERTATFTTLTPGATYTPMYGTQDSVTADADGTVTLNVPALSAVVLKADRTVAASDGNAPTISLDLADGSSLSGTAAAVSATTASHRWAETTFSYRTLGSTEWTTIGTAEDDTPRVYADVSGLADGTVIEVRAVTTDAAGNRAADSALAVVGADLSGQAPSGEDTSGLVTVPGSHNAAMGCASDWMPACTQAALTLDPATGLYTGTFTIPAGTYEWKVAVGGSWDENYGADGVAGGDNMTYTTTGGQVTFTYDPTTHKAWTSLDGASGEPTATPTAEPSASAAPTATASASARPTASPSSDPSASATPTKGSTHPGRAKGHGSTHPGKAKGHQPGRPGRGRGHVPGPWGCSGSSTRSTTWPGLHLGVSTRP